MIKKRRTDAVFKAICSRLLDFYTTTNHPIPSSLAEENDSDLWEEIFFWFFGGYPDATFEQPAEYKRLGSNDPRWDLLLHKYGCLEAQRRLCKAVNRTKEQAFRKAA